MNPDFLKKTVDILAKRAAFRCSNPDCRAITVGPNTMQGKATIVGEAAHIRSARSDGPRYLKEMTDSARSEITNGIWLCRNCHRKVDSDWGSYPAELLFAWREAHEAWVTTELGATSEKILKKIQDDHLDQFINYPPIIRRIVIDKPDGWEWRLSSELLRHLNKPFFQRMRDLRGGLYTKRYVSINQDDAFSWVQGKVAEMSELFSPIEKLLERLSGSWGAPGEPGDLDAIHHYCLLIRDALARIVEHEESVTFALLPEGFERVKSLLENIVSSQAEQLEEMPKALDEVLEMISTGNHSATRESPLVIEKVFTMTLPDRWVDDMNVAIRQAIYSQP